MKYMIPVVVIISLVSILTTGYLAYEIRASSVVKVPRIFHLSVSEIKASSKEELEEISLLLNKDKNKNVSESIELGFFVSNILFVVVILITFLNMVIIYMFSKLNRIDGNIEGKHGA